jgi:hypothetical protein
VSASWKRSSANFALTAFYEVAGYNLQEFSSHPLKIHRKFIASC